MRARKSIAPEMREISRVYLVVDEQIDAPDEDGARGVDEGACAGCYKKTVREARDVRCTEENSLATDRPKKL